jgi:hypothetical protein
VRYRVGFPRPRLARTRTPPRVSKESAILPENSPFRTSKNNSKTKEPHILVEVFTDKGFLLYGSSTSTGAKDRPYRTVHTVIHKPTEQEYQVIILDASDEFEVHIQAPNAQRECVFSLIQEHDTPAA